VADYNYRISVGSQGATDCTLVLKQVHPSGEEIDSREYLVDSFSWKMCKLIARERYNTGRGAVFFKYPLPRQRIIDRDYMLLDALFNDGPWGDVICRGDEA